MKKFTLLFSIFAFIAINSIAQVIYTEDFESLNVGEGIAQQLPEWWKTWSDNPGGPEDADITENYAVSGTKSLMVLSDQDVVMTTGHLTEGRYKMSFEMYIAEDKVGYLAAMQLFDPGNSIYGHGIAIILTNGLGEILHGSPESPAVASFSFEHDTWFNFTYIIDLYSDFVTIIVNDELIYSSHWSNVTYGYSLTGFMFYGGDPGEFYIDDIVFEQIAAANPPTNLSLEIQNINDILVSWDAPESGTPDSYYVYRNGIFVEEVIGATSFTDYGLYPAEYEYYVNAYYGTNGFSVPTETETILIEGGAPRQLVLLEVFTGTTCTNAGWIGTSLNLLNNLNLDVAVLNYFSDDNYKIENMDSRLDYYTPYFDSDESGDLMCPSSIVDGRAGMEGYTGSMASQRNFWSDNINQILELNSLYTIDNTVELVSTSPYTFTVSVEIEELFEFYTGDFNVYMALTESNIEESYQGVAIINDLVRLLDYESINFSTDQTGNITFDFELLPEYSLYNMDVIIFLQNVETATIVESLKTSLSDIVGVEKNQVMDYSVYPNPATGQIFIESQNIHNISVFNLEGKTIIQKDNLNTHEVSLNLSKYEKGIYIIKIVTEGGVAIDKLIIK